MRLRPRNLRAARFNRQVSYFDEYYQRERPDRRIATATPTLRSKKLSAQYVADPVPPFLRASGEVAARIRAFDWATTPLGPVEGWPASLKATVRMALTTRHPIFIFWGQERICLHNDAYSLSLGPEKLPSILGVPGWQAWSEIWTVVGPQGSWFYEGDNYCDAGGERTRASKALGEVQKGLLHSEEQLRLTTDAGEVGLWDIHFVTDTVFWPARVKAMFGIAPDVTVSMADFYAGLHPNDLAATTAVVAAAMDPALRTVYDTEYRTIGKEDGVVRWVAAKGRAIFDLDGRCTRAVGTAIVITRRKLTEAPLKDSDTNLIAAMNALKKADHHKDAFLATLGHELRNPLATMRNALVLLARAPDNVALVSRVKGIVGSQVDQLVRLTDDLLDMSRISHGKIHLRCMPVTLKSVLEHAVESCMPSIELATQRVLLQIPDLPAMIYADAARLVQIFGNLIGDASKFTPAEGRLAVVVHLLGPSVVTSVKDSGIGLAQEHLVSVFEPFTQVKSQERSHSGLGIGLALAKQLVEMHGGVIEARSAGLGRGSEFVVTLPLCTAQAA